MSSTNAFWGSSGIDALHCHTPSPSQGLLNHHPEWDGSFDLKESIDSQSVLELLQWPMPYTYEPQDEWLFEFKKFKGLQDAQSSAASAPTIPPSPHHNTQGTFVATDTCTRDGTHIRPRQLGTRDSSPSLYHPCDTVSSDAGPTTCVQDETDCPTPTRPSCSNLADAQHPVPPGTAPYTTVLYDWNPTTACENHQAFDAGCIQKTMLGLRDMEHNLQADTKRRMSQVEESRRV
ncbi:hypothetical protein GQX73_g85 [Xylaria multiplex]|uniref:Uncharacterized protein n=1 Tax=Xylaria multiplex TaxID=323545 RepID=A0A7C8N0Y2_9PEZI|nr:hypothetical protein GQX73_g85 [Xylaria multiplex]